MDNLDERTPLFPSAPRRWLIPTLAAMTALSIGGYLSLHSTGKQTMALPGESHLSPSPDAP